jgi:hypothetical protein
LVTGNEYFKTGCYLESSNKNYRAVLEARNFIIYNTQTDETVLSFSFNDAYQLPCKLVMQEDRNLVIYNNSKPLWYSGNTISRPFEFFILKLEDNGTLSITNSSYFVTWVTTGFKIA